MMTLRQANSTAEYLSALHGEKWIVFKTPKGAVCNKAPANFYNSGSYAVCKESERAVVVLFHLNEGWLLRLGWFGQPNYLLQRPDMV